MAESTLELEFQRQIMLALGRHRSITVWRQNCGQIPIRDRTGKVIRMFDAGPPNGAADLSGFVKPEGWRLEIEVKAAKGKRSKAQEIFARNVESGGCVYVLASYDEKLEMNENVERAVGGLERALLARRSARRSA